MIKRLVSLPAMLWLTIVVAAGAAHAAASAPAFVEGEHYVALDTALPTLQRDKIEVVEFFWYGCIHCYHFEASLRAWEERQSGDVYLVGSPAVWNAAMGVHAKAYFAAQALGALDKVHLPLFAALNASPRAQLNDESALAAFFAGHGVAEQDFRKAFNSFGVDSLLRQADARARSARIEGTPELLVNGKYRVSSRLAGSLEGMLQVADYLIERERSVMAQ